MLNHKNKNLDKKNRSKTIKHPVIKKKKQNHSSTPNTKTNLKLPDSFPRAFVKKSVSPELEADDKASAIIRLENENRPTHLELKDLAPGSVIMGIIGDCVDDELIVHLPFHLIGYVTFQHATEDVIDDSINSRNIRHLHRVGSQVICVVLSTDKQRVNLSLRPSLINAGFDISTLKQKFWLPCNVICFEEFGCSATFGTGGDDLKVYVKRPDKHAPASIADYWSRIRLHSIIYVEIVDINISAQSVTCSVVPSNSAVPIYEGLNRSLLRAGMLVDSRVETIVPYSHTDTKKVKSIVSPKLIIVQFCKILKATISGLQSTHVNGSTVQDGNIHSVSIGAKFPVRIIAVIPSKNLVFVSPLDRFISWSESRFPLRLPIGLHLKNLRVLAVDGKYAARLSVSIGSTTICGDVSHERCIDDAKNKIIPLQINQIIQQGRLLNFNLFENAASIATAPSLLSERVLVGRDLTIGQLVSGEIKHISTKSLFIKLSPYVTGILPREHATDLPLQDQLPKKFNIGEIIKCRVFSIQHQKNVVWLTSKRTFLENDHCPIDFFTDFEPGKIITGVVGTVRSGMPTIMIQFFNRIHGWIPLKEFKLYNKETKLKKGSLIQCRITSINYFTHNLNLSLNLSSSTDVDALNPVNSPLHLCPAIISSLAILNKTYPTGCTIKQVVTFLQEKLPSSCSSILNTAGENYKETKVVIPSLRGFRGLLSPGLITEHVICVLDQTEDYFIVLFTIRRTNDSINYERLDGYMGQDGNDDYDGDHIYDQSLDSDHSVLGLGFLPISHLHDVTTTCHDIKLNIECILKGHSQKKNNINLDRLIILNGSGKITGPSLNEYKIYAPIVSAKSSLFHSIEKKEFVHHLKDLERAEQTIRNGYIIQITDKGLYVSLGNSRVHGFVPANRSANHIIEDLFKEFTIGQTVILRVLNVQLISDSYARSSPFLGDMRLSAISPQEETSQIPQLISPTIQAMFNKFVGKGMYPRTVSDIAVGRDYFGVVKIATSHGVFVYISPTIQIRIRLNELPESPIDPSLVPGLYPSHRVLSAVRITQIKRETPSPLIEGSIKKAGEIFITLQDIKKNDIIAARIKKSLESGVIIHIEQSSIDAFCHLTEVDDIPEGQWESKEQKKKLNQIYRDAIARYPVGERVAARVLSIDIEARKVLVTLKPSAFSDEIETLQDKLKLLHTQKYQTCLSEYETRTTSSDGSNENTMQDDDEEMESIKEENDSSVGEEENGIESDSSHEVDEEDNLSVSEYDEEQDTETFSENEEIDNLEIVNGTKNQSITVQEKMNSLPTIPSLSNSNKLHETKKRLHPEQSVIKNDKNQVTTQLKDGKKLKRAAINLDDCSSDEVSDSDSDSDDDTQRQTNAELKRRKRLSQAEKRKEEEMIRTKEIENAEADAEGLVNETPDDFERLIVTNGNSAVVWIRYMAYYLKTKDIERAREIAERGIRKINATEESERINLWLGYLNLEATFGNLKSLNNILTRAIQYNDPKKIYFQMTYVYQRQKKVKECLEACQKCIEKYPNSKKMWIRYLTCIFELQQETGDTNIDVSTRGILVRALRRLSPRKHVAVVTAVGRLEMKLGCSERGCTYFEKLLSEHPKRTDIWGQYLDAVTALVTNKKMSVTTARRIFEKPTMMSGVKPRQMKSYFTRWLTFENNFGSSEDQRVVQTKAREYVETIQK